MMTRTVTTMMTVLVVLLTSGSFVVQGAGATRRKCLP